MSNTYPLNYVGTRWKRRNYEKAMCSELQSQRFFYVTFVRLKEMLQFTENRFLVFCSPCVCTSSNKRTTERSLRMKCNLQQNNKQLKVMARRPSITLREQLARKEQSGTCPSNALLIIDGGKKCKTNVAQLHHKKKAAVLLFTASTTTLDKKQIAACQS